MPGYLTRQGQIAGVDDLVMRSPLDRQQFSGPGGDAGRLSISSAAWPLFGLLWPSGADVTTSDCHPLAQCFLAEHLRLNALAPMKYRHGHWGALAAAPARDGLPAAADLQGRFDLIVGSDLLY